MCYENGSLEFIYFNTSLIINLIISKLATRMNKVVYYGFVFYFLSGN